MPGFNQKGPMGEGPMTGRKMGKCTNFGVKNVGSVEEPTDENLVRGRRGLGVRRCFGLGEVVPVKALVVPDRDLRKVKLKVKELVEVGTDKARSGSR